MLDDVSSAVGLCSPGSESADRPCPSIGESATKAISIRVDGVLKKLQ
jgi:hypothetical protein